MKRKGTLLLSLLLSAALLGGCAAGNSYEYETAASSSAEASIFTGGEDGGGFRYRTGAESAMDDAVLEEAMDIGEAVNPDLGGGPAAERPAQPSSGQRMIITTMDLHMQTLTFDQGIEEIESIVESFGGFIQDSYVQGKSMYDKHGTRSASFTARIPSQRLEEFMAGVGNVFNITSKYQSGQDITDSYYDTEARLNSLRIQEERLLAMMESATELEYLIQVQRELSEVQYQIDSFTASKMRMENQVAMSTVNLYVDEVAEYTPVEPEPVTFGERISRTASDSFESFVDFSQGFVLTLIWLAPFLLTLAVIAGIIVAVALLATRKSRAHRKAMRALEASAPAASSEAPQGDVPEDASSADEKKSDQ